MTPHRRHILLALMLSVPAAHAEDDLQNRATIPSSRSLRPFPAVPNPPARA